MCCPYKAASLGKTNKYQFYSLLFNLVEDGTNISHAPMQVP